MSFPTVGVIGAGQLARMMVPPAVDLGISLTFFAGAATESGAQIAPHVVGKLVDTSAVLEWAAQCDVVTFEHELVPQDLIVALESSGVKVFPRSDSFAYSQNKLLMRQKMEELGLPNPAWQAFNGGALELNFPLIAKSVSGGYDGRGVFVINNLAELQDLHRSIDQPLLLEEKLAFDYEIAIMVARSPHGQAATWAPTLTLQRDGICTETITPIPELSKALASQTVQIALKIAQGIDLVGVMAVEIFVVGDHLIINELALRPHNSGHWSIEGAVTSQFEQHLRAILDLPLGDTALVAPFAVMGNIIGIETDKDPDLYRPYLHLMARTPALKIHQYMKELRPGRKVGHVTLLGSDLLHLRSEVSHAVDYLSGAIDE
ncbi:MAG TPA: 5-(carboxyamino)imidazole ribonucleotide synthase [Candidatus Nanopelagicaceae bacterium]